MTRVRETILLFHHGGGLYGSDRVFLSIVKILSRKHRVVAVVGEKGPLIEKLRKYTSEIKVVDLGALRRKKGWARMLVDFLGSLYKVSSIISEYRPKLIITNTLIILSPAIVSRILGVKNIWFVHEHPEGKFEQSVFRFVLRVFAHEIVVPSKSVKSWAGENAKVISFVEILEKPDKSSVSKIKRKLSSKSGEAILGCVGMLHPKKGQDYFIKIGKKMLKKQKDLKFVIVGGQIQGYEDYKEQLHSLTHGLKDKFIFIDFSEDILAWISCFDLVLVPSLYEDPFPLVAQEVMFLGKPIAVTKAGGLKELVIEGENGIFIPRDSADRAADLILKFIKNKKDIINAGKKGRVMYKKMFSISDFSKKLENLVRSVI